MTRIISTSLGKGMMAEINGDEIILSVDTDDTPFPISRDQFLRLCDAIYWSNTAAELSENPAPPIPENHDRQWLEQWSRRW